MRSNLGETALFRSVRDGNKEMFHFFAKNISGYEYENRKLFIQRIDKTTTLHIAILSKNFRLLKKYFVSNSSTLFISTNNTSKEHFFSFFLFFFFPLELENRAGLRNCRKVQKIGWWTRCRWNDRPSASIMQPWSFSMWRWIGILHFWLVYLRAMSILKTILHIDSSLLHIYVVTLLIIKKKKYSDFTPL